MVLVDSLEEQALLEQLLEGSKPPVPASANGLHWLLFTPFRYPPPPTGSRFRGPLDPGVFYGADEIETACAELGFWRWQFLMESPSLTALDPKPQTVFKVEVDTLTVDLRSPPFTESRALWIDPKSYAATQDLARSAREANIGAIRYESVRAPNRGGCGAILTPMAFAEPQPRDAQTWWLSVSRERVLWQRDDVLQRATFAFDTKAFCE
ncbi:RES family NAD+ phosphorylase [Paramagnetospirillum magnetotacticum]|uniref:RES family NAD+ phosphorylase n=1 Tax=Paramagnetospirillum magnetotacticum TaxID=188 RepID=UPI00059722F4|nr:RES family NAD+ phosphorylase [Paramagnetospirillum magnetotacticum]